jgi:CPA2 family monovalent cation:H+ antiporter-2
MLRAHDKPYVAVDADIDTASRRHAATAFASLRRRRARRQVDKLGTRPCQGLMLTMDDPVLTVRLTRRVRRNGSRYPDHRPRPRRRSRRRTLQGGRDRCGTRDAGKLAATVRSCAVDLGVAVGPVIASIHDVRAKMRHDIMTKGDLDREPRIRKLRTPGS